MTARRTVVRRRRAKIAPPSWGWIVVAIVLAVAFPAVMLTLGLAVAIWKLLKAGR